jgi:F-type H+-transporting ATPase subunit gamma
MSDSMVHLRRKISTAGDLQSVVRTMKAIAASSVTQYEQSVLALHDYYHTIELALSTCFRKDIANASDRSYSAHPRSEITSAIVFGSDQGLVGQFNDVIAVHAIKTLSALAGKTRVWAVGERVHARLADSGLQPKGLFHVPNSVKAIAPLVGQIQVQSVAQQVEDHSTSVYVFHNRPKPGSSYDPVDQRLLPLDAQWQQSLVNLSWPTNKLPEVLGSGLTTLQSLIHEYLFITLFRACAESLASENASRLAAMQRADKNIDELLDTLHTTFHRQRQGSIDEELFDVVSGFEALSNKRP